MSWNHDCAVWTQRPRSPSVRCANASQWPVAGL